MTPEQFCYWLQGRAEIDPSTPTDQQWEIIRDHLALVFDKETPVRLAPPPDTEIRVPRRDSDRLIRRLC